MTPVSRIGRILDLVGIVLLLVGAGLITWAWFGFRAAPSFEPTAEDGPWAAVRRTEAFVEIQWMGVAAIVIAVGILVFSWWRYSRTKPSS